MKNFWYFWGSLKNPIFRGEGGGLKKNQYRGELPKEGGGSWYPNVHYDQQAKLKLFSLLPKLILKKSTVLIILQVESDRLICVSVNCVMSLFIIHSSLTISSLCFESDLALWTRTIRVSSEIAFLFIVVSESFCLRRSYSSNASLFTFIVFFNSMTQ